MLAIVLKVGAIGPSNANDTQLTLFLDANDGTHFESTTIDIHVAGDATDDVVNAAMLASCVSWVNGQHGWSCVADDVLYTPMQKDTAPPAPAAPVAGDSFSFVTTGVSLTATGNHALTPTGSLRLIVDAVEMRIRSIAGLIITVAAGSLGTNSTNFNNAQGIAALVGLGAAAEDMFQLLGASKSCDVSTNGLTLKVTTAANATTLVVDFEVSGHYAA